MKIAVFGATGGTGKEIVKQALLRGHHITAITRHPKKIKINHANLRVVEGDAMKPGSFNEVLKGHDAVASAVGVTRFLKSLKPTTFHRNAVNNIMAQMVKDKIKRFVCMTSIGVTKEPDAPLLYRGLIKPMLENKYEDMREMEWLVRDTKLDWTIVRPYRLTDGNLTGKYRVTTAEELHNAHSISRADVADFIVRQLENHAYLCEVATIAY